MPRVDRQVMQTSKTGRSMTRVWWGLWQSEEGEPHSQGQHQALAVFQKSRPSDRSSGFATAGNLDLFVKSLDF